MTPLWTAAEIASATGGVAFGEFEATDVTFDSREVIGGELFVALRGETTDGHKFTQTARERGATGLLVSETVAGPHVLVADTTAALEALGGASRGRSTATVIGVTGSVGKTGVKEALKRALDRTAPGATHASVKSYNNHTGVPLSLARMPRDSRFGVFEMGMNHAGELAALTRMVRPHVAVVTWIASAHREFFDSDEAIADAKGEIFAGLEPGGTAVIPFDSPHHARLRAAAEPHAARIIGFGERDGADVRAIEATPDADGTEVVAGLGDGETLAFRVGTPGRHWVNNALAVLAAVKAADGDVALAGLALAEFGGLAGRGRRLRVARGGGAAQLIDESYNANPASMAAALAVLGDAAGRRIAVLGGMRELGVEADRFHAALAPLILGAGVDDVVLVGAEMRPLVSALGNRVAVAHVADTAAAIAAVERVLGPGDVLLVKGSNGVGLSRLVDHFSATDA